MLACRKFLKSLSVTVFTTQCVVLCSLPENIAIFLSVLFCRGDYITQTLLSPVNTCVYLSRSSMLHNKLSNCCIDGKAMGYLLIMSLYSFVNDDCMSV
jgi:hypothetical protein